MTIFSFKQKYALEMLLIKRHNLNFEKLIAIKFTASPCVVSEVHVTKHTH